MSFVYVGDEPEDFEPETPKVYEALPSLAAMEDRLNNFLEAYNETVRGGKMDLVFFKVTSIKLQCLEGWINIILFLTKEMLPVLHWVYWKQNKQRYFFLIYQGFSKITKDFLKSREAFLRVALCFLTLFYVGFAVCLLFVKLPQPWDS